MVQKFPVQVSKYTLVPNRSYMPQLADFHLFLHAIAQ